MDAKKSKSNQRLKDVVIYSDNHEWMRKMYGRINNDCS